LRSNQNVDVVEPGVLRWVHLSLLPHFHLNCVIPRNGKAWINGINIEGEGKCIISEKVIIRKLQAKGFGLEGILHEINSLSDDPMPDFPIAPTIIEFCDFE